MNPGGGWKNISDGLLIATEHSVLRQEPRGCNTEAFCRGWADVWGMGRWGDGQVGAGGEDYSARQHPCGSKGVIVRNQGDAGRRSYTNNQEGRIL